MTDERPGAAKRLVMLIGAAVVVLIAALVLAWRGPRETGRVHVLVDRAPGVREGSPVSYEGRPAGLVRAVHEVPDGIVLEVVLTAPDTPVRAGDVVRLSAAGGIGGWIEIVAGDSTARLATAADTLRVERR